ncbi:MAG: SGNH hydrolase domain-containing protein, partial [Nevskiales bacterium]
SPFSFYIGNNGNQLYRTDGETIAVSPELGKELLEDILEFLVQQGIKPVIFSPMPRNGENIGLCLLNSTILNREPTADCGFKKAEISPTTLDVYAFLEQFSSKYPVIRLDHALCPGEQCSVILNDKFLFADTDHISPEGSAELGKMMDFYSLITKQ